LTIGKIELSLFTAILFINFYQDNVISDLPDTIPGDYIFTSGSPETKAETARSGNHKGGNTSGFTVKFHIHRTAKCTAGTDIDHFFLL
jgi:hypothetical protein